MKRICSVNGIRMPKHTTVYDRTCREAKDQEVQKKKKVKHILDTLSSSNNVNSDKVDSK